jgi:hypothetical protein
VRLYSASTEETLRARKFLKEWAGDGLITKAQYELLKQETVADVRTTNISLRLVMFLFTLISVGAIAALVVVVFLSRPSDQTSGVFFLIFAAASYAAAEVAASRARLYRYGIEEALAVCSVVFLCLGIYAAFFSGRPFSSQVGAEMLVVPAAGAVFSLWIWRRLGFSYAFLAAMIFVLFPPGYWSPSQSVQRVIIVAFYAIGLICVNAMRSGHRFDYLDEDYSLVEALLWLGVYLTINLQLSSLGLVTRWLGGSPATSGFAKPFYWATWVLIWCLPPVVLARGVRQKDRSVIAVGAITAILTLISNKPYLGWPRHTWDPMLLGLLLTGVAYFVRRWLARGPGGVRHSFTAARLSGKDQQRIGIAATVFGPLAPHSITPHSQPSPVRFGGGQSGGGGASGDF